MNGVSCSARSLNIHRFWCRFGILLATLAIATFTGGCGTGPATYPATGKVEFADGTPLIEGWVSFHSLDAEKPVTARGQLQPDGRFVLGTLEPNDGAVLGQHEALIVPIERGNRKLPGDEARPKARKFNSRFSSYQRSGLKFVVTEDAAANDFKIVIE